MIGMDGTLHAVGQIRLQENIDAVGVFGQHIVCGTPNNHTGALLCHLFDDLRLHQKDFFIQRQTDRINAGGQRGQREKQIADRGLFRILEAFNGKSGFFRCHGNQFVIIKGNPKGFRQFFADNATAAAILAADGDDFILVHGNNSLSFRNTISVKFIFHIFSLYRFFQKVTSGDFFGEKTAFSAWKLYFFKKSVYDIKDGLL